MSKVLLLNPPHPEGKGFTREGRCTQDSGVWGTQWPPITLSTIAAILEKDGHSLKVLDCPAIGMGFAELEKIITDWHPDFVFWNTATPTLSSDLSLGAIIKKINPAAVTGVMGTHVTVMPEIALKEPGIDIVTSSEPELAISQICKNSDWSKINGIMYWGHAKDQILGNADSVFLPPEQIPPPAWHYLDLNAYKLPLKARKFLIVAPIRGCPYKCNFCTAPIYYGHKLRKRPISNVVDEIRNDIERFGIKDFFIWADTFTADQKYVKQFCQELIERKIKISWACNSRVDTVDSDMLKLMKQAGLWMISFGLESGSDFILKKSGKKITKAQSEQAVRWAHDLKIKVSGHFIFGLAGESKKTLNETLEFALSLPLDIAQFYAAAPFPGTELYNMAIDKGWLNTKTAFSQESAVLNLPGLSAETVNKFRSYAYLKFYLRPSIIWNTAKMLEKSTIVHSVGTFKQFLRWIFHSK